MVVILNFFEGHSYSKNPDSTVFHCRQNIQRLLEPNAKSPVHPIQMMQKWKINNMIHDLKRSLDGNN